MRNCYKCYHTKGRKEIKNDADTTIMAAYLERRYSHFYRVLYRMLTFIRSTLDLLKKTEDLGVKKLREKLTESIFFLIYKKEGHLLNIPFRFK